MCQQECLILLVCYRYHTYKNCIVEKYTNMTLFKIVVIKEKGMLKLSGSKVNIAKQNIILYKISILETAFGR